MKFLKQQKFDKTLRILKHVILTPPHLQKSVNLVRSHKGLHIGYNT